MYFVWKNIERELCPELISYTKLDSKDISDRFYTKGGVFLKEKLPEITFEVNTFDGIHGRDSLWAGMPYLVFSPRLQKMLAQAQITNIQYFSALLKNVQTGEVNRDFKIANIIGCIPCMDWTHSEYVPDPDIPGSVRKITRLVLEPHKIPNNLHLFRLAELRTVIICHEQLKNRLDGTVTGVQFIELDQLRIGL